MSRIQFSRPEPTSLRCGGCGNLVQGTIVYEVLDIAQDTEKTAQANLKIVGMKIDHNCIPPVTRDGAGRGTPQPVEDRSLWPGRR